MLDASGNPIAPPDQEPPAALGNGSAEDERGGLGGGDRGDFSGDRSTPSSRQAEDRRWQKLPPLKEALESENVYEDKSDQTDYFGVIRLVADNSNYAFISCSESRDRCGRDIFLHE